eukprot:9839602-Alexandrium_andersonii.AAC.1
MVGKTPVEYWPGNMFRFDFPPPNTASHAGTRPSTRPRVGGPPVVHSSIHVATGRPIARLQPNLR